MSDDTGRVPTAPGSRERSPSVSAASGFDPSRDEAFVAGPIWQDENGDWFAEIQASGGHYVAGTAQAETEGDAISLRENMLRGLNAGGEK